MVKAIVGGNWGDEGKGKMTDMLAAHSDIVVRFQGGANAGHTIINHYGKFSLHIMPAGVFYEHTVSIIGPGVAFDLEKFFREYDELCERGVTPKVLVSSRAQILMPFHILLDTYEEERLGENSFGSTKSGIAPFYSDKYLKIGVQVCELFDEQHLRTRLHAICEYKNAILKHVYGKPTVNADEIADKLLAFSERLRPLVVDSSTYLNNAINDGKTILLEGQLGALRDPDHGIYPFTTSSSTLAGFATVGAGVPPHSIKEVLTVVKAYSSCVGAGAFVTELFGEVGDELRRRGGDDGEYGATTGRPRRVGWLDIPATRYGCMLQGTTDVSLTLIDVLGYLDEIPVCIGYEVDGVVTKDFLPTPLLNHAKPVYTYLKGWKKDIRGINSMDDMPKEAKEYIEFVQEQIGYPIRYISTGPKREDIIILEK